QAGPGGCGFRTACGGIPPCQRRGRDDPVPGAASAQRVCFGQKSLQCEIYQPYEPVPLPGHFRAGAKPAIWIASAVQFEVDNQEDGAEKTEGNASAVIFSCSPLFMCFSVS